MFLVDSVSAACCSELKRLEPFSNSLNHRCDRISVADIHVLHARGTADRETRNVVPILVASAQTVWSGSATATAGSSDFRAHRPHARVWLYVTRGSFAGPDGA